MNITELEKIIAQIKKYQLEDEIIDVKGWLRNLNEKQIGNFLSLEIYPLKQLQVLKRFLIDLEALNGNYYLEDIKLIETAKTEKLAVYIRNVAWNLYSLKSEHHREHMNSIATAPNEFLARIKYKKIKKESLNEYLNPNYSAIQNYFQNHFQEKIDAIHQNAVEYTDGDTTKELNDSVFTLK